MKIDDDEKNNNLLIRFICLKIHENVLYVKLIILYLKRKKKGKQYIIKENYTQKYCVKIIIDFEVEKEITV